MASLMLLVVSILCIQTVYGELAVERAVYGNLTSVSSVLISKYNNTLDPAKYCNIVGARKGPTGRFYKGGEDEDNNWFDGAKINYDKIVLRNTRGNNTKYHHGAICK